MNKKNIIITVIFLFAFLLIQTIFVQGFKSASNDEKNSLMQSYLIRIINKCAASTLNESENEEYYAKISQVFTANTISFSIANNSDDAKSTSSVYTPVTSKPLNTKIEDIDMPDDPIVLIYHTHTTESYTATENTPIVYSSNARSKDKTTNMAAIGDIVCQILEKDYGIKTVHDTALHDYPSYSDSYNNSLKNINDYMSKYPSIEYVFDIHRDGLNNTESAQKKYKMTINGTACTKIMIVVGLNHENSNKNVNFAKTFKSTMDKLYPGIMLNIVYRETSRFNQFTCPNALLFEVGSNLSTFEEARISAEYLARAMAEVIYQDIKKKN
jgi:stage II sporulation protein P